MDKIKFICNLNVLTDIDECVNHPCKNGATCIKFITREVIAVNANLVILEITAKQVRDNFPSFACTIPLLNYIFPQ